ncbi:MULTISPECIES: invasion associated locus B family protein [unclassified Bradyrhizobium]|uniref:invasion associated locus B family protein n=1 Tax=unclassified Bradyrhizobium TaxID=2631580 RepID=UPI002478DF13|nr:MULTISPECIES: invasion associated locus B family protein [unclassified Bradyrhizobium]WGR69585.1 invasion associated locus B family protein [Bradyrhizobium sp. ISRA426]WGR81642.1 invasion associated locus B family protein [Bradyrhizobium sp. ISRA430]WGR84826.1 invasion associated locus B family protein [Bradyrhizobium sp. ISRA432]
MISARDCLAGLVLAIAAVATSAGVVAQKTAQPDNPAEVATRGQREARDISYGDWQKLCFKAGGAPILCRTSITGKFPTGQMAVRVDLIEREDAPAARLQLFVPVGMYLQQPAKLTIDQGSPHRVPYSWCVTNACIAADVADPGIIKEMESGTTLALEVVDSNLLALTTSIPLAQFAPVHKGAPSKMLEQYVDE